MTWRDKLAFLLLVLLYVFLLGSKTLVNLPTDVTGVLPTANGGMASGMIAFVDTGSCPTGWTEQSFSGKYILLTVAANSDVGGTGGSTSYTPAGTNAWPGSVPTQAADSFGTTKFTTNSSGSTAFTSETARGAISWPSGTPAFTGTPATIQPTYVKLIACQKN